MYENGRPSLRKEKPGISEMTDRLVRCKECNEVINMTGSDFVPEYRHLEESQTFLEIARDDRKAFQLRHATHPLEELILVPDSYVSRHPYSDPVGVGYFEATNGRDRFLIKRWRESIDTPLNYQIIPGEMVITKIRFYVQADDIRKEIRAQITSPSLPEPKIDQFIRIVKKVISKLDLNQVTGISAEGDTPLISHCKLDDDTIDRILEMGRRLFDAKELNRIKTFIYQNNEYNDVMTLKIVREFEVKPHIMIPEVAVRNQRGLSSTHEKIPKKKPHIMDRNLFSMPPRP